MSLYKKYFNVVRVNVLFSQEWSFYTHSFLPDADRCHDVTFQVWRPVDVSIREYQLVGENVLSEMAPIQVGTFCSNGGQSS